MAISKGWNTLFDNCQTNIILCNKAKMIIETQKQSSACELQLQKNYIACITGMIFTCIQVFIHSSDIMF